MRALSPTRRRDTFRVPAVRHLLRADACGHRTRHVLRLGQTTADGLRLHIYGGMKVADISEYLGEGYKSVEHRLGAARKAVRQQLRGIA